MATEEPIISFKAGKVDVDEETSLATPKPTPGLIKVLRNPDDPMFSSFIWEPRKIKNRLGTTTATTTSSTAASSHPDEPDELLLFPGDAIWYHVPECTTGRVFCLQFKSSGTKIAFWMQSPTDKGKEVGELSEQDLMVSEQMKKILHMDEEDEEGEDDDDDNEQPEEDQEGEHADQEMAETDNDQSSRNLPLTSGQLQSLVQALQQQQQNRAVPILDLADAIAPSEMAAYVSNLPQDSPLLQSLLNLVPEGLAKSREELIRVIQSSQFAQGMSSLSSTLNQSGLGAIVSGQLGYEYSGEGVDGFLTGVRKASGSERRNHEDKEDHDMDQ